MEDDRNSTLELTASIVSAYVSNNSVPVANLTELVSSVHASLQKLSGTIIPDALPPTPAVPVKKSVTPDYIISLEDGRKFKSLKRHLASHHKMTPEQYRAKWGLPSDYPMVAPNYAATRSELARSMGLGRKAAAEQGKIAEAVVLVAPAKTRGRKKVAEKV